MGSLCGAAGSDDSAMHERASLCSPSPDSRSVLPLLHVVQTQGWRVTVVQFLLKYMEGNITFA